jgi:hypothetical protein
LQHQPKALFGQGTEGRLFFPGKALGALKKVVGDFNGHLHDMATHTPMDCHPYQVAFPNRELIFIRTASSILMSGGQGRLKPSPGNFFVALMPSLLPMAISLVAWSSTARSAASACHVLRGRTGLW